MNKPKITNNNKRTDANRSNKHTNLNSALINAASEVRTITNQGTKMLPGADKDKRMMQLLLKHQDIKVRSRIPFYAAAYLGLKMGRLTNIQREHIGDTLQNAITAYIDKYHICERTGHTRVKNIKEFGDLFGIETAKLVSTTYKSTDWNKAKKPWEILSLSIRPLTRREIVQNLTKNKTITNNKIKQNLNPRVNVNFVPSSLVRNQNKYLRHAVELLRFMAKEKNTTNATNKTNVKKKKAAILYDLLKRVKTQQDITYFLRETLDLIKD